MTEDMLYTDEHTATERAPLASSPTVTQPRRQEAVPNEELKTQEALEFQILLCRHMKRFMFALLRQNMFIIDICYTLL